MVQGSNQRAFFAGYGFRIPNLPRSVYEYVKAVREAYKLSYWQVVILGTLCLREMAQRDRPWVEETIRSMNERYPAP